ncbi:hypothetical protein [Bacteroides ovatus]|uniref:hypothetical protein n=1 Tax=Bacteroides ovatus TaxID=28116 RepID=UPI00115FDEC3|nr:hypothetical protein [Bacteroides ovatus]
MTNRVCEQETGSFLIIGVNPYFTTQLLDNELAGVSRGHYNMMLLAGIMEILSATIKEMRVGPSQSVYRNRLQTITSCVLSNQKVVNVVCNKSEDMVRYV